MRKYYLDNIRWITVVTVVIYHVLYMYNAEGILGGLGKITNLNVQPYDVFQYFVYPWFMPVLFIVAGISSRLYLEKHTGSYRGYRFSDGLCWGLRRRRENDRQGISWVIMGGEDVL